MSSLLSFPGESRGPELAQSGPRLAPGNRLGHQKPTSSRLNSVALPPELVVSVLVTRSVQKRAR
jgi:hypothetical protein